MIRPRLIPSYLLAAGGTSPPGTRQLHASAWEVVLGPVGRCPHEPTHVIGIFDNSGSVAGAGGNDVIGNRFVETRLAFAAVARRCRCGHEIASCISFDSPTSIDVTGVPLRGGLARIEQGLAIPRNAAGSSVLGPSLSAAERLAQQYPNHNTVLIVVSDFELFDQDVDKTLEYLCNFSGEVHAVVLRSSPPTRLVEDERVTVTQVTYDSPAGAVANAVLAGLTTHRRPTRHPGSSRAVTVSARADSRSLRASTSGKRTRRLLSPRNRGAR